MPHSATLVPEEDTRRDIYLVLDDFGSLGRVWRETDEAGTNRTWMIRNLLEGRNEPCEAPPSSRPAQRGGGVTCANLFPI